MKTLKQHLQENGYEETWDNELPHYIHYTISQEQALKAVKEWLQEHLDWASKKEIYDLANTYKELIEELEQ